MGNLTPKLKLLRSTSKALLGQYQNPDTGGVEKLRAGVRLGLAPQLDNVMREVIKSAMGEYLVGTSPEEKITVVHYTSIDVLVKMFNSVMNGEPSFLRLYDTFHSNDPDEGKYLMRNAPEGSREDLLEVDSPCAYVASFIKPNDQDNPEKVSDNLYFWKMYGRNGMGCALAVELPAYILFRVKYGPAEAREAVKKVIEHVEHVEYALDPILGIACKEAEEQDEQSYLKSKLADIFAEVGAAMLYLHKSEAYEYEREVRVIETIPDINIQDKKIVFEHACQNLTDGFKVRHYREREELRVNELLITGSVITLGPCVPDSENLKYYLEHLKRESGLLGPEIRQSKVSYRNG